MDTATIINAIDAELETLVRVKNILGGHGSYFSASHAAIKPHRKKRTPLSAEARERIAAAQRKRWAAQKKCCEVGL